MKVFAKLPFVLVAAALCAGTVQAQTVDEVIEKHLAAEGGRAALAKLDSRITAGTISVAASGMTLTGEIATYVKAPNKSRVYFKLDMSAAGAGDMIVDRRCDGKTAFESNSMQGDRELTGAQLQDILDQSFPSQYLKYKESGATVTLAGKELLAGREALVLQYTPKGGTTVKQYLDPQTFLILRQAMKIEAPQVGTIEQTYDFSDYRDVDGVKVPFTTTISNPMNVVTMTFKTIEHNKPIDEGMFSKVK